MPTETLQSDAQESPPLNEPPKSNRNIFLFVVIAAVAGVIVLGIVLSSGRSEPTSAARPTAVTAPSNAAPPPKVLPKGSPAPPLAGPDVVNGQDFNLESYKGKPTLVAFWSSTCSHCLTSMPGIEQLYKQSGSKYNFVSVGSGQKINAPPPYDSPEAFIKHAGLTMPTLLNGPDNQIGSEWGVRSSPNFFILDKDLKVVEKVEGAVPLSILQSKLQAVAAAS